MGSPTAHLDLALGDLSDIERSKVKVTQILKVFVNQIIRLCHH